ncbi:unnamed protein product [Oikopleura dioica]|uniref:Uncharacterized protein n=1 Tax=Oikopleura dioica TaxID=34765 RepID=E4XSQ3_OIKDI|nr:unnamed protein product [Oikopleura dioica]CBY38205.1 unnamed protein product [Oikopleura dioica]
MPKHLRRRSGGYTMNRMLLERNSKTCQFQKSFPIQKVNRSSVKIKFPRAKRPAVEGSRSAKSKIAQIFFARSSIVRKRKFLPAKKTRQQCGEKAQLLISTLNFRDSTKKTCSAGICTLSSSIQELTLFLILQPSRLMALYLKHRKKPSQDLKIS